MPISHCNCLHQRRVLVGRVYSTAAGEWNRIHYHRTAKECCTMRLFHPVQAVSISGGPKVKTPRVNTKMKMKFVAFSLGLAFAAMSLSAGPKKTMLMNPLGPSQMAPYIANTDGSGEHPLFPSSGFDYNASFSPDGK